MYTKILYNFSDNTATMHIKSWEMDYTIFDGELLAGPAHTDNPDAQSGYNVYNITPACPLQQDHITWPLHIVYSIL